mmetsp:Transcript_71808/g.196701  ORF Transcript_71808/g.196701 Transcript_71808/m.196701 type:complete len:160 (-) Transcript_71808:223-702(-)
MVPPSVLHPRTGCLGCIYRQMEIERVVGDVRAQADLTFQEESAGARYADFEADLFWFSTRVDAWNDGGLTRLGMLQDSASVIAGKHPYDSTLVKCPVSIWHGSADLRLRLPECLHYQRKLLPHAAINVLENEGHALVFGPNEQTIERILQAVGRSPLVS